MGTAVFLVHGQKALKGEAPGGLAGGGQGRDQGAGAGDGHHGDALLGAPGHQLLPRVRDGGHPRVGDQGAVLPRQQPVQHRLAPRLRVVAVIGQHGLFQPQVIEQLDGHPGVLRRDKVRLRQGLGHALGDVPQVADGRGDQIKRACHEILLSPDFFVSRSLQEENGTGRCFSFIIAQRGGLWYILFR